MTAPTIYTVRNRMSMQDRFHQERADYDGARASRLRKVRTGIASGGSHADYHYRREGDYLKLLETARDLDRNNAVVTRMLDLSADATVQDGINAKSASGNSDFDDATDAKFEAWANDPKQCDAQAELTFGQMQRAAFRQMQCDGDIAALLSDQGSLQHIESHRIRTPKSSRKKNVVHGVELDGVRRRQRFWVTNEDVDPSSPVKTWQEVHPLDAYDDEGRRRVAHLYNPKRFTQTRGVTALAPTFDLAGMAEDIHFAKLVQAQMVSSWGLFIKRTADFQGDNETQIGERRQVTRGDGSTETIENIGPGMLMRGQVGEEPTMIEAKIPNPEYFPFIKLTHTMMMAAMGLPYMLVFLDASDTNFSGWRGAYDIAKMGWRRNQQSLIVRYILPVRRWKIDQWIAEDPAYARLAARRNISDLYRCTWHRPTYPYIQPAQDAATDILMLANMLTSPPRYFASKGEDAYEVAAETISFRKDQIIAAANAANEINTQCGLEGGAAVTWRDLIPLPSAQGLNITLNASPEPAAKKPQPEAASV